MRHETKMTILGHILVTVAIFAVPAILSILCYVLGV